jgi:hypothetical protein
MEISFPNIDPAITMTGTIGFQVIVDGKVVTCEFSTESLKDQGKHAKVVNECVIALFLNTDRRTNSWSCSEIQL